LLNFDKFQKAFLLPQRKRPRIAPGPANVLTLLSLDLARKIHGRLADVEQTVEMT